MKEYLKNSITELRSQPETQVNFERIKNYEELLANKIYLSGEAVLAAEDLKKGDKVEKSFYAEKIRRGQTNVVFNETHILVKKEIKQGEQLWK
jgi:hypothetical protein